MIRVYLRHSLSLQTRNMIRAILLTSFRLLYYLISQLTVTTTHFHINVLLVDLPLTLIIHNEVDYKTTWSI